MGVDDEKRRLVWPMGYKYDVLLSIKQKFLTHMDHHHLAVTE